ncbi:hypothetical protein ACERLL_15635 [Thiohalorhabdus sp. Cl-TMA]|uniref:MBL fold metallo-hydrolase n=2 Tax=Thiohalorhabdus methylotrophus TaxID=3242694 RepID=A0ABV4U092_9GAMM
MCGKIAAMVNIDDIADRGPRALADGETLATGRRTWQWLDAPQMPHGWDAGYLCDTSGDALLCGDLFTQGGADTPPLTESDILGPSEDFRKGMDYYSHTRNAPALMEKLAATEPRLLACMHGSAWAGDGGALLRALGRELEESEAG